MDIQILVNQSHAFFSDEKLVSSLLQNLIDNAIKYRKIGYKRAYLKIYADEVKGWTQIKISDNGMGINEQLQDKVFDMFFRANEISQGTGLGLYIVKNTIEKMGGTIEFESEEGKGTCFTLYIPNRNDLFSQANGTNGHADLYKEDSVKNGNRKIQISKVTGT